MITPEEEERIINKAVEKALLMLPSVFGELWKEKITMNKLRDRFWNDNKDFKGQEKIVRDVLTELEGKNPGKQYGEILKEAPQVIRERMKKAQGLDMGKLDKPEVSLGDL
jgi:hypothetical protein